MDTNSQHQLWSLWAFTVRPGSNRRKSYEAVRTNSARFGSKGFGSASQMKVEQKGSTWVIKVRTEGHPVHDPAYVAHVLQDWTAFFVSGFGVGTEVSLETKLEAGDAQDGKPRNQLIIMPSLAVGVEHQ